MTEPVASDRVSEFDYLTPSQVADIYKVSERTVYRWIDTGELRHVRVGGTVRIPRSALAEREAEEASA